MDFAKKFSSIQKRVNDINTRPPACISLHVYYEMLQLDILRKALAKEDSIIYNLYPDEDYQAETENSGIIDKYKSMLEDMLKNDGYEWEYLENDRIQVLWKRQRIYQQFWHLVIDGKIVDKYRSDKVLDLTFVSRNSKLDKNNAFECYKIILLEALKEVLQGNSSLTYTIPSSIPLDIVGYIKNLLVSDGFSCIHEDNKLEITWSTD